MQPKKTYESPDLFTSRLENILNPKHPLYKLSHQIDWTVFETAFGKTYSDGQGRPGNPIRVMVALHYIKYTFNLSDEDTVLGFVENPYWQYFCGFEYFQHKPPIDPSSLTRFRNRLGKSGVETLFRELIQTAKREGHLTKAHLNKVNVDTTVQEKAVAFPTDARLYYKARRTLVRAAKERDIDLRQNYNRLGKSHLIRQGRYSHASQMKRARRSTKKLKTYLGAVHRDIQRKVEHPDPELARLLEITNQILTQQRSSKNKIYSVHEPEVECISKGKVHKRYEFGNKVGLATTSRDNWIVGIESFHGNPYDGHTLNRTLSLVEEMTDWEAREVYADLGYRGHDYAGETRINIVNHRHMKRKTRAVKKWFKRRAAIEPIIGHVKSDHRMSKNYLKGVVGDQINALLCGCGFNMRKLLSVFLRPFEILVTELQKVINLKYYLKNQIRWAL